MESIPVNPPAKGCLLNTTWWKTATLSYENESRDGKLLVKTGSQLSINLLNPTKVGIDGIPSSNGRQLRNRKLFARQVKSI